MEYKTPKILLEAVNTAQLENIPLEEVKKFIEESWPLVENHRLKLTELAMEMLFRKD